jgi:hypothetical protein
MHNQEVIDLNYVEAKKQITDSLLRCAEAHEAGRLADIEEGFDAVDRALPRGREPEFDKLHVALNFWDGWIDASNHNWKYYEGINAEDWPRLARQLAATLKEDQETTDVLIKQHFDFRNRSRRLNMWQRLFKCIIGNQEGNK